MTSSLRLWTRRFALLGLVLCVLFALLLAALVRPDIPVRELYAKYTGPSSKFADIEGMKVHYRDEGQGLPLVLLHGTSSSLHTWEGWVERLKTHRRVVRLDLPGYGLTGPAPEPDYRPTRQARVVTKLLDRLGIQQADFAGSSLGGRVALTLALEQRARVRRLILIDASGLSGQQLPRVFRLTGNPIGRLFLRWLTPRSLVRSNLSEVYGDPARISEDAVDRYHDLARREGNRQALLDRFAGPPSQPLDTRLAALRLPTLILWGERDSWIPLSFGKRLQALIAGSQLVTYADAGHVPMEELPAQTARDADDFLEATDSEPALGQENGDGSDESEPVPL